MARYKNGVSPKIQLSVDELALILQYADLCRHRYDVPAGALTGKQVREVLAMVAKDLLIERAKVRVANVERGELYEYERGDGDLAEQRGRRQWATAAARRALRDTTPAAGPGSAVVGAPMLELQLWDEERLQQSANETAGDAMPAVESATSAAITPAVESEAAETIAVAADSSATEASLLGVIFAQPVLDALNDSPDLQSAERDT